MSTNQSINTVDESVRNELIGRLFKEDKITLQEMILLFKTPTIIQYTNLPTFPEWRPLWDQPVIYGPSSHPAYGGSVEFTNPNPTITS